MAGRIRFAWMLLAVVAVAQAKPLNSSIFDEPLVVNEIDHGKEKRNLFEANESERDSALPTSDETVTTMTNADPTAGTVIDTTARPPTEILKPGPFAWLLAPLAQKIQFSSQSFLQDRLGVLKEILSNLGVNLLQNATAKQLAGHTSLLHFANPSDSGFYTNRLEPAGFLGGNGWFANKGGILGGPGAIVSTGSLFTDYPTPYRK